MPDDTCAQSFIPATKAQPETQGHFNKTIFLVINEFPARN